MNNEEKVKVDIIPKQTIKENTTILYGGVESVEGAVIQIHSLLSSYKGKVNPLVPSMGCKEFIDQLFFSETNELNSICSKIQNHLNKFLNIEVRFGLVLKEGDIYKLKFNIFGIELESKVTKNNKNDNSPMIHILPINEINKEGLK